MFGATGTLNALATGAALVVQGTVIGTVRQNGEGKLELGFNAFATQPLVNAALRQITYRNASDDPPASVQLAWTLFDGNASGNQGTGGGKTVTDFTMVTIIATSHPLPP